MKKFVRVLCLALVAVTLCATLASCGKVSGTYTGDFTVVGTGARVTYEFGAFGKVTMTVEGLVLNEVKSTGTYEGKYEVIENDDDTMTIKFEFESEEEDAKTYGGEQSFSIDKENDTIKIGLLTYKKAE